MKLLNKLVILLFTFSFIVSVSVIRVTAALLSSGDDVSNFLICGIDDAAGNSDTVMLVNADERTGKIKVLHIPRDTMVIYESKRAKINSVFAISLSRGMSEKDSLTELKNCLSAGLNITFDASCALKTSSIVNIVDALGGVTVFLDKEIRIKKENGDILRLETGQNTLSGTDALCFLRHRKSYPNADLGRITAQEIFIKAFLTKIASLDVGGFSKLYKAVSQNVVIDASLHSLSMIDKLVNYSKYKDVLFYTLPGETVTLNNRSYYKPDRNKAEIMLREFFESSRINDGFFVCI